MMVFVLSRYWVVSVFLVCPARSNADVLASLVGSTAFAAHFLFCEHPLAQSTLNLRRKSNPELQVFTFPLVVPG